jgi:hypothetical protein
MIKSVIGTVTCGMALMASIAACGASSAGEDVGALDTSPSTENGSTENGSETTVVPAGPASAELGISRWEATADGYYGLQADDKVVAEFHSTDAGLESVLPEAAVLDGTNAAFPALTQRYYDAFAADVQDLAAAGGSPSAAVLASTLVTVDCFINLTTCFASRDAIFQQSRVVCVCQPPSFLTDCGSLVTMQCNL